MTTHTDTTDQNMASDCLRVVRQSQHDTSAPAVEVVAVHGLYSSFERTWCEGGNGEAFGPWVRDLLPYARVFAYQSTLDFSSDKNILDRFSLRHAATTLLAELSRKVVKNRQIIFLCHNIGGILIKELLWIASHDERYLDIALSASVLVLFGTPDVSSDWDDALLKLVLATIDRSEDGEAKDLQRDVRRLVQAGPMALKASSLRYEMIEMQYKTIRIFEGGATTGIGKVVLPVESYDADVVLEVPHSQLCVTEVLEEVADMVGEATLAERTDHERHMFTCRQRLAACHWIEGNVTRICSEAPESPLPAWQQEIYNLPTGISIIYGGPGSGKSVVASQIAQAASSDTDAVVISFYFSLADDRRRSYRDLLLSLLLQLFGSKELLFETAFVQKIASELVQPKDLSVPNLYRLLSAMLIKLVGGKVVCIIDALDECDKESRAQVMGDFKRMAVQGLTGCRVIFTCRPHSDIEAHLGPFTEGNSINLEERMKHARDLIVIKELDGDKFTSVRKYLESENATPLKVKLAASLGALETSELADYNSMYAKLLAQLDAPLEWVREVLLSVALAKRPLTVSELAAAMGVDGAASLPQTLGTIRIASPKQLQHDLESALGSLVLVEDNVVRLVHGTLRELILEQSGALFWTAYARTPTGDQPNWRSLMLCKCLLTLSIPGIREMDTLAVRGKQNLPYDNLSDAAPVVSQPYAFVSYAASSWFRHLTEDLDTSGEETTVIQQYLSSFWDDKAARSWWLETWAPFESSEKDFDEVGEQLKVAAFLGAQPTVDALLSNLNDDPETILTPALRVAASRGDYKITDQILKAAERLGADLWLFAVKESCSYGHAGLLRKLFSWWVDTHGTQLPEDGALITCLDKAARFGQWSVICVLLDGFPGSTKSLDLEQEASLVKTAARNGRDGVVFQLLKTRKRVGQAQDEVNYDNAKPEGEAKSQSELEVSSLNEALFAAADFGSAATARILAQAGACLEHREGLLRFTALHTAASEGNTEALEQLLDHDASIESQDDQDATPLLLAVLAEHVHTTRALLARGANPDHAATKSTRYRALHIAARAGNAALTRLLLESGASENPKLDPPEGHTPLHLAVLSAAADKKHETVRILLEFGVDIDAQNGEGSTALHLAVQSDTCGVDMVKLLVGCRADIDKLDNSDRSPLYYAVKNDPTSMLARHLWDPYGVYTNNERLILFHAVALGITSRVQQLLDAGCDKEEKDKWGRNLLDVARPDKAMRALLSPDTEPLSTDHDGETIIESSDGIPEGWCPSPKRPSGGGYECDKCLHTFINEVYYHCCDCSRDCPSNQTYDLCMQCFETSTCKGEGHQNVHKRFVGGGIRSHDEWTSNIDDFGIKPVASNGETEPTVA